MGSGDVGAATINGHHLYGSEGYPSLRYVVKNGVLLHGILHLEFHRTVRKPLQITPQAFLLFLDRLYQDESYLLRCLKDLRRQLESGGCFLNCQRRPHPITGEDTYYAEQGGKKGMGKRRSIYLPIWLVDDLQAGLPTVKERLKAMRKDVEQKMVDLSLYLNDQASIPDNERNIFLRSNQLEEGTNGGSGANWRTGVAFLPVGDGGLEQGGGGDVGQQQA